jgi:hypothetical protein
MNISHQPSAISHQPSAISHDTCLFSGLQPSLQERRIWGITDLGLRNADVI